MAVRLARQSASPYPPRARDTVEVQWIGLCGLRAASLRKEAERANSLQTERAVIQYGAAAALERAAHAWASGEESDARSWMAAAENTLAAALVPVPWIAGA